eukprot:3505435-Pyramimonas_sp.AAC.2
MAAAPAAAALPRTLSQELEEMFTPTGGSGEGSVVAAPAVVEATQTLAETVEEDGLPEDSPICNCCSCKRRVEKSACFTVFKKKVTCKKTPKTIYRCKECHNLKARMNGIFKTDDDFKC